MAKFDTASWPLSLSQTSSTTYGSNKLSSERNGTVHFQHVHVPSIYYSSLYMWLAPLLSFSSVPDTACIAMLIREEVRPLHEQQAFRKGG
jgi:hypothetical protein